MPTIDCTRCRKRPAEDNRMMVRGITFNGDDTCPDCFRWLVDFHYGISKSKREIRSPMGQLIATDVHSPWWENHLKGQAAIAYGSNNYRRIGLSIVGLEGFSK